MRLIDADALKKYIMGYASKPTYTQALYLKAIEEQQTAYNVDKVVKELEKSSKWVNETNEYGDDNGNDYIPLSKAIEIVKQGGVSDDVCEYRSLVPQLGDVYYLTSCGHRHNGMLNGNKCNYCGKKIKVVE